MAAASDTRITTVDILGVPIAQMSVEDALREIERRFNDDTPGLVTYANAHSLNIASEDAEYRALLRERFIVFKDGICVGIGARVLGRPFLLNITFTDFNSLVMKLAAVRSWRVYFLGGAPGVPEAAAEKLMAEIPGFNVVGCTDGFTVWDKTEGTIADIRQSCADLVVAGMGNPRQEKWLAQHLEKTGARLGHAVGGYLDFVDGKNPRAPQWMQRVGMEWFYRMTREPSRLWRRYVLGNPEFLLRVLRQRFTGKV